MSAKIIAVAIQKGGTGKTTSALAITAGLSLKGYKVLAVDLDAQGNFSGTSGAVRDGATVLDALMGKLKISDAIRHTKIGDVAASGKNLSGADAFITGAGKERRLQKALESVSEAYDYIIIDTPPALGILTINALTASHGVIIPAQADLYSLESIEELSETIKSVKKYVNPDLTIEGIVLTRYNPRTVLSVEISALAKQLAAKLETKVFNAAIRESITVKEAQINRQSLYDYAPNAKVTEDYMSLLNELLGKE